MHVYVFSFSFSFFRSLRTMSSPIFYPQLLIFILFYQVTKECLDLAISVCKDGVPFKKIGKKIRFVVYVQEFFPHVLKWACCTVP